MPHEDAKAGQSMPRRSVCAGDPDMSQAQSEYLFCHEFEFLTSARELRKIALYGAECGVELHTHRHHPIARHDLRVPDPAALVGVFVAVRVGYNILGSQGKA